MEAPYLSSKAKACRNCAKAKAKCYGIVKTTGKCERCSRLNKEDCVMPVKGNHKSLKMTRNAQIAQLEQKVESLTSILTTTKQIPSPNDASNFRSTSLTGGLLSPSTSAPSREGMQQHKAVHSISARLPSIRNRNPMSSLESCMVNSLPSSSEYTPVYFTDPDKLLNIYRDKLAPQVPYVPIPSKITAHDLMLERPFLSKAVMTAASFENNVHYVELTSGLMKHFIEHIIFRGEKTLDLLQGLIVYINWFHYPLFEIRQMSNLLGLMSGLAADLGISRKRSSTSERHEVFANEIASEFLGNGVEVQDQTLDEKRALLGCFYLLSWATASLSKIDAMRYTPFIKESNEVIARNNGPQSDVFLVHCIKLQCIIERIRNSGLWDGASSKDFQALRAPTAMCVKAFWEELKSFKNSLPPELQNNIFMLRNYYLAEILLFEICFYMDPVPETYNPNSLQRIDIFYACLSATESYFKIFMAAPATTAFSVSVVLCGQMVHAMAVLSKLSLYEAEDWDLTYVRNVCNLSSILARMLERIVATSNAFDSIRGDSYLNTGYRKMEMLKTWYDTKLAAELRGVAPSCAKQGGITDSAGVQVGARAEDAFTANNFDLLGDEFWQAIPGDWDFLQ